MVARLLGTGTRCFVVGYYAIIFIRIRAVKSNACVSHYNMVLKRGWRQGTVPEHQSAFILAVPFEYDRQIHG